MLLHLSHLSAQFQEMRPHFLQHVHGGFEGFHQLFRRALPVKPPFLLHSQIGLCQIGL